MRILNRSSRRSQRRNKRFAIFGGASSRHQKSQNGVSKEKHPSISSRNRGVYFLRMYPCGKINATFAFPSRSSRASVQNLFLILISSFPNQPALRSLARRRVVKSSCFYGRYFKNLAMRFLTPHFSATVLPISLTIPTIPSTPKCTRHLSRLLTTSTDCA
jgi:hypothetical protein